MTQIDFILLGMGYWNVNSNSTLLSTPHKEVNISDKAFSEKLLAITCYHFIKIIGIIVCLHKRKQTQSFSLKIFLVSDRIINGTQYKLVLEGKYNCALQLVLYKIAYIYMELNFLKAYTYGFKGYVLLINLSLKLVGVISKRISFLIWNGIIKKEIWNFWLFNIFT